MCQNHVEFNERSPIRLNSSTHDVVLPQIAVYIENLFERAGCTRRQRCRLYPCEVEVECEDGLQGPRLCCNCRLRVC
jgi:hypothetical protein